MTFRCPSCGEDDIPTRVLADPVTLIVIGECSSHGVLEISRVYVGEPAPTAPTATTATTDEPYPADSETREPGEARESVHARSSYKPGACCGLRLGEHGWCQLPVDHQEPHAA